MANDYWSQLSDAAGGNQQSSTPAPAASAASSGGGGGYWSQLSDAGGASQAPQAAAAGAGHHGLLSQIGSIVNPLNLVRGVTHMAEDVTNLSPMGWATQAIKERSLQPLENPLGLRTAIQQHSITPVEQQIPTLSAFATHLGKTVAGAGQLPIAAVQAATERSTQPLTNSILGQRVHQEGVLPSILSTAGDVAAVASLGSTAGAKLGFGNLAEANTAEGLARTAAGNAEGLGGVAKGTINTADAARAAQGAAQDAGNVSMANEYQNAAENLDRAAAAREAAASRGSLGQLAENATAKAQTVAHFGNQVANAPAELFTKYIPGAANLLTGGKAGELASQAAEAVRNAPQVQGLKDRALVRNILQGTRSEGERLSQPVQVATKQIGNLFKGAPDAERAAYLAYSGDAANTLVPLAKLPDAEIQATIDANPYLANEGVTPTAIRKAADFAVNPQGGTENLSADEAAKIAQAHQVMEEKIYGPKENRHVTGYLDKEPMNPVKQTQRQANVEGRPAPMAVDQLTQRLTSPIDKLMEYHQGKLDEALQQGTSERPAPLSQAQREQAAAREARAATTEKLGTERQGINARAAAEEGNAAAQATATRRSIADVNREIQARSERLLDLQTKREAAVAGAPNATSVQAAQVKSVLSHAADLADTLHERATLAEEAGDTATAAQLRQIADQMPKSAADLTAPTRYIAGGEVPEEQAPGPGGGLRMRSRQATTSERARHTALAPLTAEGQAHQVLGDINSRLRNQPHALIQEAVGDTAKNVASDPTLTGEALAKDLEKQGYKAWRPEATGGVEHPDRVTPDSKVVPTSVLDKYQKWTATKDPNLASKVFDTVNKARILKLLGSAFPAHKILADLLLAHGVAGVSPLDIAKGVAGAARDIRSGDLPADVGTMKAPPENPEASTLSKAANKVTRAGMTPMRLIDTAGRDIVYKTLIDKGYSPMTAARVTKEALGDLQSMSPTEKAAGRRIVTYYPWQRHLADVVKTLVTAHPAGLAEAASLAQADQKAHPNQGTNDLADFANPFGSFILTPSPKPGQSMPDAILGRIQQSLNPAIELGFGLGTGMNVRKGTQITTPKHPYGSQKPTGPLLTQPGNAAGFTLHTLVPQIAQIQDVLGRSRGPQGYIPYRQDTGQPEAKTGSTGGMQPGTTKLDAIAKLLGFPHAQPPAPKK